ncbi:hypothetical protein ACPPVW_09835 [Leifsonia sp. McL0607]|uniref:hypothetical protein n=1 Tax=Leifsonia sp. McL0607 TaxID=3415672 RepID=UPI003CF92F8F
MEPTKRLKSRAALTAAALAVPALVFAGAAPANAAVANPTVSVSAPATANIGDKTSLSVTVTSNGTPAAGESVTLTVDATAIAVFGAASQSITSKTDASGVFNAKNILVGKKAGTVNVTATSNGVSSTTSVTIGGAAVAAPSTLTWDATKLTVAPNSTFSARVQANVGLGATNPTRLYFTYTGDVTGPVSGLVNIGRAVSLAGVKVGPNGGTITAWEPSGKFTEAVLTVATR